MTYYGAGAAAGLQRVAPVPRPMLPIPRMPRVPFPNPAVMGVAAGIAIYAQWINYQRRYIPGDWEDAGVHWWVPGGVIEDANNDGAWKFSQYKSFDPRDALWKNLNSEQEWYGTFSHVDFVGRRVYDRTRIFPPNYEPAVYEEKTFPLGSPPPGTVPGDRGGIIGGTTTPGDTVGGDEPLLVPPLVPPGTATTPHVLTTALVTQTSVTTAVTAYAPIPEVKMKADRQVSAMITAFFSAGGELIDFTRCLLKAMGHTYIDTRGRERVIPRDQWVRTLARYTIEGSSTPEAIRLNAPNPRTGNQIGEDLSVCLFLNWLEDGVIAAGSKTLTAIGDDLSLNIGFLGVQSLINVISGETPYSELL